MNANAWKSRGRARRGYGLLEVTVSLLVLMTAMVVTVRVLGWLATERRASDRRQWAILAASNVLERVTAEPFERITAGTVKAIAAKADADTALPGSAWEVGVVDEPDAPVPTRRVSVELRWRERAGGLGAPVRLTAWVHRRGAAK